MQHSYLERNIGVLTEEEQKKISATRLFIGGCGVGSNIAESAVRTGFQRLTIIDGDTVEKSNLNRQIFTEDDLGKNKALATAQRLQQIAPRAPVRAIPRMMKAGEVKRFVSGSDIIVDALDLSALEVIIALHRAARQQGKLVIAPVNVGFGAMVFVFGPGSLTAEEFYGIDPKTGLTTIASMNLARDVLPRWAGIVADKLPPYLLPRFEQFMKRIRKEGWCPVPQVAVGAQISAAQVVACAVQIALGQKVKLAPEPIRFDAWVESLAARVGSDQ